MPAKEKRNGEGEKMKNIIISMLVTYIYYDLCVVKNLLIVIFAFFIFWGLISEIDETIAEFNRSVRRGEKLNRQINRAKRG